jgi:competence protein ComEC
MSHTQTMTRLRLTNFCLTLFLLGIFLASTVLSYPRPFTLLTAAGITFLSAFKTASAQFLRLIAAFCIGFLYMQFWRASHYLEYPAQISTSGIVIAMPDVRQDKTFLTIEPDQAIGKGLHKQPKKGALLVKAGRYPPFQYGDTVTLSGEVVKPEAFSGFDYPLFLERVGVYGIMNQPKIFLKSPAHFSPLGSMYSLGAAIETKIQTYISEPESSFLGGILLGSKRAIPTDVQDALKATGTSHIIAISGANITILLTIFLQFLPLYERRQQFIATLLIALFITVLTGAPASVIRGAYVAIIAQYIRMRGRRAWASPLILFSMALILLNNPLLLRADPGFQLSFAAYAGLAYLGTPIKTYCEKIKFFLKLPEVMRSSFSETLAASLGTAPLSFILFGQLSLLGLIVNPLVLWLLPLTTLIGLIFATTSWVHLLGFLISLPLWLLLHTMLAIIQWFSRFSFAVIHWKP